MYSNAEKAREYQRDYYAAHREAKIQYRRAYYEAHKDAIHKTRMAYYWKNHGKIRAQAKRNQSRDVARGKRRRNKRKRDLVELLGGACQDCEATFPGNPEVFDFDHRNGDRNGGLTMGQMFSFTWAKLLQEVERCDLVCSNCHRIRSAGRGWRNGLE